MQSRQVYTAVDSHTEGMPTRVITGGVGPLPGATMADRRRYLMSERDDLRTLLMYEPRGHAAMSGAILQPPSRPDADAGVVFIEVSGCLPMCGHGTIGVATVLVETGTVQVKEPVTEIRLDTPAGLVAASVEVSDGRARAVTIRNVPAYLHLRDAVVTVPGFGPLSLDVAWGGNFYAILPAALAGLEVTPAAHDALVAAGLAVISAVNEQLSFAHPEHADITYCHHVIFTAPAAEPGAGRSATVIHPGWIDRSPCGTGTSARLAQLHARGELALHEKFEHYSLIGSRFTGELVDTARVGPFDAVVPTIRGRAWVTALATYLLDPDDPFPAGFLVSGPGLPQPN
jgi:proline racemase